MFLPQGLFSLVLAVAGSSISGGVAINAGTAAVPRWLSPSCPCWLFCRTLGRCPIIAMPWFGVGISSLVLVFPVYSVVVKGIFRENVTFPTSGLLFPRVLPEQVAQNPKLGTLLVKEG